MVAGSDLPASVEFGRLRVLPHRREMIAHGKPIKVGGRAFDILMTLIEARGAVVSKKALMARVWPGQVVEENNLQSHISALRVALGPDRHLIRTVSGRGYQFIGEIRALSEGGDERDSLGPKGAEAAALPPANVPEPVSELIGRDDELAEVANLMGAHRLVTLTGTGGIGKTRLAVALARELRPHFADGVWLAQFSPLADPKLVPAAVAAAVGLGLGGEASVQSVAQGLAGRRLLLVLDTCEHVIEIAASMAEAALGVGSELRVLATSRESLKAEGEWVYPVSPLAVPTADVEQGDFFEYGAIRLFLEQARAADPRFAPDRPLIELIAAICRRLDGIPLAIELAAARASALGVEGLAARLDDRFHLLTGGRRTALPRHQTLRATLDWSYALLDEAERILLRRLAVFAGTFDLDAVRAVVTGPELSALTAVDGITSLIAKSLVATEGDGAVARYRLLDTMRAYAAEELDESGEREPLARRHAEYYRDVFQQAEFEWESRPTAEWLADYTWRIDNIRVALDWAFSSGGDASIGVALTTAAEPLWMHLSLVDECRRRAEQALAALGENRGDPRGEMKAHAALAASLMYIRGAGVSEVGAAWAKAFVLAENLADTEFQLRSLCGLWAFHINSGRQRVAVQLLQRCCTPPMSSSEPFAKLLGERMLGVSEHHLGDQSCARRRLEGVLAAYVTSVASDYRQVVRFNIVPQVMAGVFLARTLWLQGDADQAVRIALNSVEEARAANHANSLGYVLSLGACLIALWRGDLEMADDYIRMLLDHSTRHGLSFYLAFGRCYQGQLIIRRGDVTTGLQLLRTGLSEFIEGNTTSRFIAAQTAEALRQAGRIGEGLAVIEGAIERSRSDEEVWATAELLRIKGELLRMQGIPEASAAAEDQFRQALELSRQQGALSWELRAATSLAQVLRDQGRSVEAFALLQRVYDRFTEGFETADLREAKSLLEHLQKAC